MDKSEKIILIRNFKKVCFNLGKSRDSENNFTGYLTSEEYSFRLGYKAGIMRTVGLWDQPLWNELAEIEQKYIKNRLKKLDKADSLHTSSSAGKIPPGR